MTKDEMLEQVNQRIVEENYDTIQKKIKDAMHANQKSIFVVKPGFTDIYDKYEEILEPTIEMLKNDGFSIEDDPDNSDYLIICW